MLWTLPSAPPHDFYLALNVHEYFDFEHEPELMPESGFIRSLPLPSRDIMVCIRFNGDAEQPEFSIECEEVLSESEREAANRSLSRILGLEMDLKGFYDQAAKDSVLGGLLSEFYGHKRVSRASLFEDAMNRIIQTQIAHKPTARKMVYQVRQAYGTRLSMRDKAMVAWPQPHALIGADPMQMKPFGLSLRKGEYVVGLAHEIVSGNVDPQRYEQETPQEAYARITQIRGIGPTTAQDLIHMRPRTDGFFPSVIDKGQEKGLRRWIIWSYGGDPELTTEQEFQEMIRFWKGYEACAIEFLFLNWVVNERNR